MKELLKVYQEGPDAVKPEHVPYFLDILSVFVNTNGEAQDEIEDTDFLVHLIVDKQDDYYIKLEGGKMSVSKEPLGDPTLTLRINSDAIGELITDGDAVSAYMNGKIEVEGDISEGMAFQSIMELLIYYLDI